MKNFSPIPLKIWLLQNEITQTRIAGELGVSLPNVNKTVNLGLMNRRIYRWLIEHGCPRDLLREHGCPGDVFDEYPQEAA